MIKMKKPKKYKENETFQLVVILFALISFYIAIIVGISALLIYMVCGYVTLEDAIILPIIFVAVILVIAAWLGL